MDRFHLLSVFVAVAETESFAASARKLGLSPPAVTRAIAALEERLGNKLFVRTTRHVRTTETGRLYLENARRILGELDEADDEAMGMNSEPRGQLTITAPVLFGGIHVMPVILEFLERYPKVKVTALLLDRVVNLLEEGVDLAVRIGELPLSSMNAVRVGQVRRVLVAAPEYLAKRGLPTEPDELEAHSLISASAISPSHEWRFSFGGKVSAVKISPHLIVTNNDAAIQAAVKGFGITRVLSYQVAQQLEAGQLRLLLEGYELPALPIHIVHREGRRATQKVRSFLDLLTERLRATKTLSESPVQVGPRISNSA